MATHCIVTGELIGKDNDSKAHVIPSALGGRLKPKGIVSKKGNGILDEKFDFPLVDALQSLMNLLNGSRDRSDNQPTRMTDESGKEYIVRFGEPLELSRPEYEESEEGGASRITIKARTLKEARTLLGRVRGKHPEFDTDEALKHAVVEHEWADGMLQNQLQFGPRVVFPACFVAASIFAAFHRLPPHPLFKTYVEAFDPDNPTLPRDTFYFMPASRPITAPGQVTHILALVGDAETGRMLAYVELFNLVCVGIILPFAGQEDVRHSYAIDVLTGAEVSVQIDEPVLRATPSAATHETGDPSLFAFCERRLGEIIQLSQQRAWQANVEAMVQRAFGPPDGRPLLPPDYARFVGEVVEFMLKLWKHPAFVSATRQQHLPQFDAFCTQLGARLPPLARDEYRRLIEPLRARLAEAANA
jgi:hypothetical protein